MVFKLLPEEKSKPSVSGESIHRLPAQALKGAAAAIPGVFGDVASLVNDYVAGPAAEAISGKPALPYEETTIGKILPTTSTHIKNLEEGIPYLKPKNKVEQFANDVSEDAVSLFLPGKGISKLGLKGGSALKSLATSIGANSGAKAVEGFTGDEKKGAYTKIGLMFLGSALNKPGVQKEVSNLYKKADELLPKDATVNATRLQKEMRGLQDRVLNGRQIGDLAPSERFVVEESDTILRQTPHGEANVGTLKSALRSLNEKLQKAVFEAPDKSARVRAKKLATQINKDVKRTLADYGKKNPEWWKTQKNADEAFAALQQSNFATNFIKNNVSGNLITHGLLHALGLGANVATGVVPYQAAKIVYRISKSPTLAKHYAGVLSAAASENAALMNKELKNLDDELQKEESKKKKFRILD